MGNRVIKDWTASKKVEKLSVSAEVFFTRLIMKADDYGNYPNDAVLLRSTLFPRKEKYTSEMVRGWMDECREAELILYYEVNGEKYLNIPNFDQALRRMKHTYPPPTAGQVTDNMRTNDGQVTAEEKRNETESETEVETKGKPLTLAEFQKHLDDEIWKEQMQSIHKFKNLDQAIAEVYGNLLGQPTRLARSNTQDFKKLVNSWLSNMKPITGTNGTPKKDFKINV